MNFAHLAHKVGADDVSLPAAELACKSFLVLREMGESLVEPYCGCWSWGFVPSHTRGEYDIWWRSIRAS